MEQNRLNSLPGAVHLDLLFFFVKSLAFSILIVLSVQNDVDAQNESQYHGLITQNNDNTFHLLSTYSSGNTVGLLAGVSWQGKGYDRLPNSVLLKFGLQDTRVSYTNSKIPNNALSNLRFSFNGSLGSNAYIPVSVSYTEDGYYQFGSGEAGFGVKNTFDSGFISFQVGGGITSGGSNEEQMFLNYLSGGAQCTAGIRLNLLRVLLSGGYRGLIGSISNPVSLSEQQLEDNLADYRIIDASILLAYPIFRSSDGFSLDAIFGADYKDTALSHSIFDVKIGVIFSFGLGE